MSGEEDKDKKAVEEMDAAAAVDLPSIGTSSEDVALFNPSDFQTAEVHIALMNPQAKIEVREGFRSVTDKKTGKKQTEEGENLHVRFTEFIDKGIQIQVPTASAELSHTVMMRIELKQKDKTLQSLNVSGRVMKIEIVPDGYDVLDIELTQFGPTEWNNFKNYFSNRQTEIENLFESMKGR